MPKQIVQSKIHLLTKVVAAYCTEKQCESKTCHIELEHLLYVLFTLNILTCYLLARVSIVKLLLALTNI